MRKVLFPTEFSKHASQMFHYALELAHKLDAELLVMHAFGKPDPLVTNVSDDTREHRVLDKLNAFIENYRPSKFDSHPIRAVAYLDYPADAILNVAKKENVQVIVMGMTGKNDEVEKYLGSNALRVLRLAECPILVIPANLHFKPLERIVFTTNFEFEDIMVLNHLRKAYDAEIDVLHVFSKDKDRQDSEARMKALEEISSGQEKLAFTLVQGADVEDAIEKYVIDRGADLLAMTTHKRNLFTAMIDKSLTRNIARDTITPLFVFKTT